MPPIVKRAKSDGRTGFLFLLLVLLAASAVAQDSHDKITETAVWKIPADFVASAHKACDSGAPAGFSKCFIDQMTKAGASADAVSFTRTLYNGGKGDVGILTGFHAVGPVDIGWVTYPLRANTNYGLLLLNGKPQFISAEDMKHLDHKGLEQSFQFQDVKKQFPR